jgi:aryl-alcohol dehydrogenase-like predicted oxidoreductase
MEYRRMGRSGVKVSEVCLGTAGLVGIGKDQARTVVDRAFDAGINFFDTANSYGQGAAEEILGELLKGRRREAVVATKFYNPVGPGPNDSGASRVHIMNAIEDSLRRLQMDHVDLYYVHHTDEETPLEETLSAMDDLVRQGKVRYAACSNYAAWRLCDALSISDAQGLARFECYQAFYNLVVRDIEQELVPLCLHKGVGIVVWSPLGGGFLTGRYKPGERQVARPLSESGAAWQEHFFAANANQTLGVLLQVAQELGRTPAQVALRWLLEQPGVTSVTVGTRTADHLRDSAGASGWRLEEEPLARLNAVSRLPNRYPESFESALAGRRAAAVRMPSLKD